MKTCNLDKKPILIEATMWKRSFALLIDYMILSTFILFPFDSLLEKFIPKVDNISSMIKIATNTGLNTNSILWITSVMGIIMLVYFAVFEAKYAQTPGKMIMKIFAVTINSNQKNLVTMTFWQGIKRSISIAFIVSVPIIFFIDAIYALFNPKKQRLLEKFSQTQTIQVEFI